MATLKQIQQQLNKLGFGPLTEDGAAGPKTTAAIKKFQASKGLTADGIVGPKTIQVLFAVPNPVTVVTKPAVIVSKTVYQDKPTLQRIQLLHPKLRAEALAIYNEINRVLNGRAAVRFTYTLRTFAEQAAIYNQGRSTPGPIVTNAKAGQSFHNYGLAIDIALLVDKDGNGTYDEVKWDTIGDYDGDKIADWMEIVRVFKAFGWTWGADWDNDGITKAQGDRDEGLVDAPHFQKVFGYKVSSLLAMHNAGKTTNGYVNI
jgi:peptidoglycan LD-endopeptidase CwlK